MTANFYLLASVALVGVAQLLIKRGVSTPGALEMVSGGMVSTLIQLLQQPFIIGGLLLFGLATVLWLLALSLVELSYAFPFVSLSVLFTTVGAKVFLRESLSTTRKVGIALICLGVGLIALS